MGYAALLDVLEALVLLSELAASGPRLLPRVRPTALFLP
jgi:hypothetical protein